MIGLPRYDGRMLLTGESVGKQYAFGNLPALVGFLPGVSVDSPKR